MSRITLIIIFLALLHLSPRAQQTELPGGDTATYPYWIEMMQDQSVNFFKVQRAFETYWKDRPITKGCGWKPFKRWEYMMSKRVSPTGERPSPDQDFKEYQKYFQTRGNAKNTKGSWKELGPTRMPVKGVGLGRLNGLAFHPTDSNIIWAGAPAGGLWKTIDGGQSWYSNTDGLPTLGVSAIAVDYTNPDILYIGTGDRDANDAAGIGVMKSIDGGQTWQLSNIGMGNKTVGKLLIDPIDPNLLYAATSDGIFRTNDAGVTWTMVSPGGDWKDLVFKPGDNLTLYGANGTKLYRTNDGGDTWVWLQTGLGTANRGAIGVSPANPSVVYFLLANNTSFKALYRSLDGGDNFSQMSNSPNILATGCTGGTGGQGYYDLAIAVDPFNENTVFVGGVNVWRSNNAGQNWTIVGHWTGDCSVDYIHADQHVFEWNPLNNKLYAGCDGGCWYTGDLGQTWTFASQGLGIAQVYKIGQSKTKKGVILNGYQDNGTNLLNDTTWTHISGGDGMECAVDPVDYRYRYAAIYYGTIYRIFNANFQGAIASNGTNGINESGDWISPFFISKKNPQTMFLGLTNVWRTNNARYGNTPGVVWTKVTSNVGSGLCAVLSQSYANPEIVYLIKTGSRFYRTDDASATNPTWYDLSNQLPNASTPTALETHPSNPDIVYCTSGKKVYVSHNRGNTWTDISVSIPQVNLNTIVYCKGSHGGLYVGSDIGVFYKDDFLADWIPFTEGLPANGRVTEVEIFYDSLNPGNSTIRAGTYGRGLWESDLYQANPVVDFYADDTLMASGCAINFHDMTSGYPTSWAWSFPGGSPASSTAQNPAAITYSATGTYDVQLIVSNSIGTDTLLLPGYITISANVLPVADFSCSDSVWCSGTRIIHFYDASDYCPGSWQWTVDPANVSFVNGTTASSQDPEIEFTADGVYTVSLTATNVNGSGTKTKNQYILIGGYYTPYNEGFEYPDIKGKGWTLDNPDNDYSWINAYTGGLPNSTHSAKAPIYGTNSFGHKDKLISPPLNLSWLADASIHFSHAYAQYDLAYSDTLHIYVSEDCGLNWTRVFTGAEDGSGVFATQAPMTAPFTPMVANDWCAGTFGPSCQTVDISAYAGKKNVKIAFESVSSTSNNIYLDDIIIDGANGIPDYVAQNSISIYPNPSTGRFNLILTDKLQDHQLDIFTPLGQLILHREISASQGHSPLLLDLGKAPKGVYYLVVTGNGGKIMQKLFIQ